MARRGVCALLAAGSAAALLGCATERERVVEPRRAQAAIEAPRGPRTPVLILGFANASPQNEGLFAPAGDALGEQARAILTAHLQQSGRFAVVEREAADALAREAELSGAEQRAVGARFAISGSITGFGRRDVGDRQAFGILGRGRSQQNWAEVALEVIDVESSTVAHSVRGAGEVTLENREVLGTGGTAGFDGQGADKALDLAIAQAVDRLIAERSAWDRAAP